MTTARLQLTREQILTIESWRRLSRVEREAVEAEAASMPLPGIRQHVRVSWDT